MGGIAITFDKSFQKLYIFAVSDNGSSFLISRYFHKFYLSTSMKCIMVGRVKNNDDLKLLRFIENLKPVLSWCC